MRRRSQRLDYSISWCLPLLGIFASCGMLVFIPWLLGFILKNLDSMHSNMGPVLGQALRGFLQSNGWILLLIVFAPVFLSVILLFQQIYRNFRRALYDI